MNEHLLFFKRKAKTYIPLVIVVAIGMVIGVVFDMTGFNAESIKNYLAFFFTVMLVVLFFEWIYFYLREKSSK